MGMKGLIRKEWYSLWSQYRIHMLAMLGLGVLLPIIKNTDFFLDESFWIYWAVITIFYILMHSVEYEKNQIGICTEQHFQSMEGRLLFQNISLVLGS